MIKGFDHTRQKGDDKDVVKPRRLAARSVELRVYDRFVDCGIDSPKQIPVGLIIGNNVEILVGMFPRDVTLIEVIETARAKRNSR